MGFTTVIIKRDSRHLLQVIIKSVTAFHVVNNPLLIGKTVFEMVNGQRERIILRFESGKECTVGSFLETDKLHQVHTFAIHLLPYLHQLQNVRITKIGFNGPGRVDRFTDITKNKHPYFRKFRQPTLREAPQSGRGNFLL